MENTTETRGMTRLSTVLLATAYLFWGSLLLYYLKEQLATAKSWYAVWSLIQFYIFAASGMWLFYILSELHHGKRLPESFIYRSFLLVAVSVVGFNMLYQPHLFYMLDAHQAWTSLVSMLSVSALFVCYRIAQAAFEGIVLTDLPKIAFVDNVSADSNES